MKKSVISDEEAMKVLDESETGVNQTAPVQKPKVTKLGKLEGNSSAISGANDARWKVVPFDTIPSKGAFYPADTEITIRSASVMEIRHWSTIDEADQISVNEGLNFILENCLRFKFKGQPIVLSWQDISVVDRLFFIFKIHELTFPNGENKLMKTFTCTDFSEKRQINSSMLQSYDIPEEISEFYNPEYRAFYIKSDKFDPFYLTLPTLGAHDKIKAYITDKVRQNSKPEKWFIRVAPYLIEDYQSTTTATLDALRQSSMDWHQNKMMFVTKAVDLLEKAKVSSFQFKCPKCGKTIQSDIFSSDSFTVKNLFIVSARLADLV